MATRAEFVNQIYQAGVASGLSDAAARVTAAQAAIESNYGESGLSADGNNFFGIKAGKSWKGEKKLYWTTEIENGKKVRKQQYFRTYATPEEGIADRMAFMESRFPDFNKAATGGEALDALQNGVYGKYFTADQAEYEGAVNHVNANYLGGTPVPPARIAGAAGATQLASAGGKAAAPMPFPNTRRLDFNALPAPEPLRPRVEVAALGNYVPGKSGLSTLGPPALTLNPEMPPRPTKSTMNRPATQPVPNPASLGAKTSARALGSAAKATGAAAAPAVTTKTVANPAYAEWAAKYGTTTAPSAQETMNEQLQMRNATKAKPAAAAPPPAPPKTIVVKTAAAAPAPSAPAKSGFDLGGLLKQGTNYLGSQAQGLGNALGNTATQVQTGLAKTGQAVGDVLQSEAMKSVGVRTAFIDPIIAKAFTNKSYGATENAAAARQAVPDGFVRGASGKKLYKIGQTYQSSKGMVVATADGFRPAGSQTTAAAYSPPAKVNPAIAATSSVVKKPAAKPARTGALGYTPSNDAWFNSVTGRA